MFSLDDIDLNDDQNTKVQPTAEEYMAYITVRTVTHMELAAEAKSRPRQPTRPNAADYVSGENGIGAHRDTGPGEVVDGPPAGPNGEEPDVKVPASAIPKQTEPLAPIDQADVRRVAFFDEATPAPQVKKYADAFAVGLGHCQKPSASLASTLHDFDGCDFDPDRYAAAVQTQEARFDYKKQKQSSSGPDVLGADAHARVPGGVTIPEPAAFIDAGESLRPRDYAAMLMKQLAENEKKRVPLDREQKRFLARVVDHIEDIVKAKELKQKPKQRVFLLLGQGGSGKSELIKIIEAISKRYFGQDGYIAMASSNTAARNIKGDTIHSSVHLHGDGGLSLESLSKGVTSDCKDRWNPVEVLVTDEISLVPPTLFGAGSYRICLSRRESKGCQPDLYTEAGHAFGSIPLIILAGDFMQLSPFENNRRVSLVLPAHAKAFPEHKSGIRCFNQIITDVVILEKTHRFRDEITEQPCDDMKSLFKYMRKPKGPLPADLWRKLNDCVVTSKADPRLQEPRRKNGYEMGIYWEAVGRLMQYRPVREAREAGQMLIYIQAIDIPHKTVLSNSELRRALQTVSMSRTGNLLGMLPVFVGMRVRFNYKLSAKDQLMNDSTGTVTGFKFHGDEFSRPQDDWRVNPQHEAWQRGYIRLRKMPTALYVKMDDYDIDDGFGKGVVAVYPKISRQWDFHSHYADESRTRRKVKISRIQLPLAPEKVRTVQTAQGLSMDSAVMTLSKPDRMSPDDHWMHIYVMLSRVRTMKQLALFSLPDIKLFERGPPAFIQEAMQRLERRATAQLGRGRAAEARLGWSASESKPVGESNGQGPPFCFASDLVACGVLCLILCCRRPEQ